MELRIIGAAIAERKAFHTINKYDLSESMTDRGNIILKEIGEYYERDPGAQSVDKETLLHLLCTSYERHADDFKDMFGNIPENVSAANVVEDVLNLQKVGVGYELANALLSNGHKRVPALMEEYQELEALSLDYKEDENVFVGVGLDELFDTKKSDKILAPKVLNDKLDGGLLPGDNVLFFGVPEIGKSACLINAACGYLLQGVRVLYICNEDSPARMLPRFLSRLTRMTKPEMMRDTKKAMEAAFAGGYENLAFVHMSPGTFSEIINEVEKFKPDVVFIDQLRHINVGKTDGKVTQLEKAGILARQLAAKQNVICISSAQAAATAIDKAVLDINDVDSSKIGLPGSMDVMVGIGCNDALEARNQRMLSICKNKTGGGHAAVRVRLNEPISMITGEE